MRGFREIALRMRSCLLLALAAPAAGFSALAGVRPQRLPPPRSPRRAAAPHASAAAVLAAPATALASRPLAIGAAATALVATIFAWVLRVFNTPSRSYRDGEREAGGINSVGEEYDAWTSEGILEYYWGEHIHLGYYEEGQRKAPLYGGKDFVEAKYDFIDRMLDFSQTEARRRSRRPPSLRGHLSLRRPRAALSTHPRRRRARCSTSAAGSAALAATSPRSSPRPT